MVTRVEAEDFLYAEAALLDAWQLDAWLALWAADGEYVVPATDAAPDADPRATLALVADDMAQLRARCKQLASGAAWAEVPRSRLQRMVTNVRIVEQRDALVRVESKFVVHRVRRDRSDAFAGTYRHELVADAADGGALRIRAKRVLLVHDSLFAHGGASIIL